MIWGTWQMSAIIAAMAWTNAIAITPRNTIVGAAFVIVAVIWSALAVKRHRR